ncbi:hypothetical protein GALL_445940 [mine drainage metagenome]|uniref:Uncharacterized protein n=1 Tax=mine drainage metagenome TaxID=410659 RepID=A0A1J5QCR8_9ZZZZ
MHWYVIAINLVLGTTVFYLARKRLLEQRKK